MLLLNFCHIFLYNDSEVVGHLEVFELLSTLQSGIHTGVPTIVSAAPWIPTGVLTLDSAALWTHKGVLTLEGHCCPLNPQRGANSAQGPQNNARSVEGVHFHLCWCNLVAGYILKFAIDVYVCTFASILTEPLPLYRLLCCLYLLQVSNLYSGTSL